MIGVWKRIVAALSAKPAYVLVFGVCAMFFLAGIGSAAAAVIKKGDAQLFGLAIVAFTLALLATWAVVREVERAPAPPPPPPPPQEGFGTLKPTSANAKVLLASLEAIASNIQEALALDYDVLTDQVLAKCNDFRADSSHWRRGMLVLVGYSSNEFLLQMYRTAKKAVFATSVPEYDQAVWQGAYGDRLLEAHKEAKVPVTRIFVFNRRSEVLQEFVDTMEKQHEAGIRVRVYFDDEDEGFQFPPAISRDFTIVDDGEALGITQRLDIDVPQAAWYFKDNDQVAAFQHIQESLLAGSLGFAELATWWRTKESDTPSEPRKPE